MEKWDHKSDYFWESLNIDEEDFFAVEHINEILASGESISERGEEIEKLAKKYSLHRRIISGCFVVFYDSLQEQKTDIKKYDLTTGIIFLIILLIIMEVLNFIIII